MDSPFEHAPSDLLAQGAVADVRLWPDCQAVQLVFAQIVLRMSVPALRELTATLMQAQQGLLTREHDASLGACVH